MLKKLLPYIIMILGLLSTSSSTIEQQPIIYLNFGNYRFPANIPNTVTSYDLYVTKELVSQYENNNSYVSYKYKYKLWGISRSRYYGHPRNSYMQGFQIYINHSNQPLNYYPLSFYLYKEPTVLYEVKANDPQPHIFIRWSSSYYDPAK